MKTSFCRKKPLSLKDKLRKKEVSIGSWITLAHTSIAEIMSNVGFEWLTVDMEHSAITLSQAQQLIQVIELSGIIPLARVADNDPVIIKRVMDIGAHGVIVPMVNTREDAIRAVEAVKYPPAGIRGVGLARAQGYGLEFERYKRWVNKGSTVIVQVEHIEAVENLEEILNVRGVDGFIVGPYDLSASIGRPGEFKHPDVKTALRRILQVSKKMHKPAGFHVVQPDVALLQEKIREGYKFLGFSSDALFLGMHCIQAMKKIKNLK